MQQRLLAKLVELTSADTKEAGGKGSSLGELTNAGFNVPAGFVITTEAYRQFSHTEIPEDFKGQILVAFDELNAERVSVRSSAVAEDSSSSSWAGQFESYLNVKRDGLVAKVKECWDSVEGAKAYAEQQSGSADMTLAVVVQKMVNSEVSGVVFSTNPVTKSDQEIMIEATYGLGELLVQGMVTPDNYLVNKQSLEVINKQVQPKKIMLVYDGGETKEQPVPEDKTNEPCLDEDMVKQLAELAVKIEQHYGSPQDIEWALESGVLYILQSRPITT